MIYFPIVSSFAQIHYGCSLLLCQPINKATAIDYLVFLGL